MACFFVISFCSLFLKLFVGLNPAQNTKGIELHMNNKPEETFGFTRKTKQCTPSRFVKHKTKQFCTLLLKSFFLVLLQLWPQIEHIKYEIILTGLAGKTESKRFGSAWTYSTFRNGQGRVNI